MRKFSIGRLMNLNNLSLAKAIGLLKKTRKVIMIPEQIMGLKKVLWII